MKKIKLILMLVVLSSIITIIGCKKEKDTPTPTPTPPPTSTCPTGYTGTNCATQITPSSIRINKITITKFPQYDGSSNWDNSLDVGDYRPELYIKLLFGTINLFNSTIYFTDANYNQTYEFDSSNNGTLFPISIIATSSLFTVQAFDYDSVTGDDLMGTLYFSSYNNSNGFPSILTTTSSNLEFKIYVTYIF